MNDDQARNESSEKPRPLFATIRPESKYRNQQPTDKSGNLIPFPVTITLLNRSGRLRAARAVITRCSMLTCG